MADRNPWRDADRAQIQPDRAREADTDQNGDRRYKRHDRGMNEDSMAINEAHNNAQAAGGTFPQEATPVDASDAPESEGMAGSGRDGNDGPNPVNGPQTDTGKSAHG
jgi:23S rRNA G2445 N2-methylase RlmL